MWMLCGHLHQHFFPVLESLKLKTWAVYLGQKFLSTRHFLKEDSMVLWPFWIRKGILRLPSEVDRWTQNDPVLFESRKRPLSRHISFLTSAGPNLLKCFLLIMLEKCFVILFQNAKVLIFWGWNSWRGNALHGSRTKLEESLLLKENPCTCKVSTCRRRKKRWCCRFPVLCVAVHWSGGCGGNAGVLCKT